VKHSPSGWEVNGGKHGCYAEFEAVLSTPPK